MHSPPGDAGDAAYDRRAALQRGRRHPLYRVIRAAWWVLAIWLSAAVLIGVIRGTFV